MNLGYKLLDIFQRRRAVCRLLHSAEGTSLHPIMNGGEKGI